MRWLRRPARALFRRAYRPLDRAGIHVLPKHYYSPIPDYAWLDRHPEAWRRPVAFSGVTWDLDAQLEWLETICSEHASEVDGHALHRRLVDEGYGLGYTAVDTTVLHCVVRKLRPARVVEIGGGVSTAIVAGAGGRDLEEGKEPPQITTVEPFPSEALASLPGVDLVPRHAQLVGDDVFARLDPGDLLFVDSTHVVKTGSELLRLYLEVVPALPPGVLVHVHDVTLPFLHHRTFGSDPYDWQETSLLLALLTHNARLRILCCLSALHYARPDELKRLFPAYRPQGAQDGLVDSTNADGDFPCGLWLATA